MIIVNEHGKYNEGKIILIFIKSYDLFIWTPWPEKVLYFSIISSHKRKKEREKKCLCN